MAFCKQLFIASTLLLLMAIPLGAGNSYNARDRVPLFVNKIGPLHNPIETYRYYELPFCQPDQVLEKKESLGEVLNGDRLANVLYELEFAVNKTQVVLCLRKLSRGDISKFRDAVINDFYYQMYYDDLPLWGFIGKVEDVSWTSDVRGPKYFLFTHVQFDILYNRNQIIEIRAFSDPSQYIDVTEDDDINVEFTYSVFWNEISTPYKNRMDRYSAASLLPILRQTHWFSFINSVIIVILLVGLLTVLFMRHLKNDMRKWTIGGEDEDREVGWKHFPQDVLRCPTNLPLFCAVLGSGTQLLAVVSILFSLSFLGVLYPHSHGALYSSTVIAYILTSAVAGYRSSSFCSQYSKTGWRRNALMAGALYSGPFVLTAFILNLLAAYFGITAALPLGTILCIVLGYTLVAIPSLILGGVFAQSNKSELQSSPVTQKYPREARPPIWYLKTPAQMFLGGLIPFSAIVLELHNLCATIWGYKIYTLPGILFATFLILVVVTSAMSIGLTYFQLTVEDHEWWWRSVLRGGSTAIYVFAYCVYYYFKSNMRGIVQTSFFFGYSACMCYAFFLMLGTISFQASLLFVQRIFRNVKTE